MAEYDTFILTDLNEFTQDQAQDMIIRDLASTKAKYCCKVVKARASSDPDKYGDRLWPRLGRGQWVGKPWSIEIIEWINPIPEEWR
ncbi:MAG: hypothetical protein C0608_11310 [Deltaproteobacteria bacterium]|nr:MAG: hypothetical protein C0608_11310 [Deltaproteobacteria bacterium]